ncbi:TPA: zinc ribbon domain-containing protein [Campylobacter coli]|nr:zinc ribbon domain-containing protein [Campylobacter coli]HEG5396165.1 zinc ribbon domain-containing protein [Campylobacter coli]
MNKYLEQLVLLSKIDQEIDSFEPKMESISKTLKDAENKIAKFNIELNNLENEIQDVENQKVQNNAHISEFSAKIKELSKKSGAVKTEKEANALKIEEDIAKEQLDAANDEIVRLDKILENKELFKKELLEEKSKEEQNLDEIKVSISSQMDDLEKERMNVYAKKTKLVAEMNQKVLSFYEKIRKWAKNTAVVPVKKQACYGCFMKIYDKTYLSVIKGEEIITCPHCGRILYKEQEDQN